MKVDQTKGSLHTLPSASPEQKPVPEGAIAQEKSFGERRRRRRTILLCVLIFAVAAGGRLLLWHDTRAEVWAVQTVVAQDYRRIARILREGGLRAFLSKESPLS